MSRSAGPAILSKWSGRGLATADLFNDGQQDAVISNMSARPSLLVNQKPTQNHWVELKTVGTRSNRDGIGARITLSALGRKLVQEVRSGSTYNSSSDLRVHFGLGAATKIDSIEVRWPSGLTETFAVIQLDSIVTLKEGTGNPASRH